MPTRSVLTIATGKRSYMRMALNLAASIAASNPQTPTFILTDHTDPLPNLPNTHFIRVCAGELPKGFSAKLHLDRYAQTDETLFIDADCLVLGSLDQVFAACNSVPVGVFGVPITEGEWFGDTKQICRALDIPYRPLFNGGVYFLRRGAESEAVFKFARDLEPRYDDLGFVRLRGQPNEEPLMSAAIAHYGIQAIENDGSLYADFQWWPHLERLDPIGGQTKLINPPPPDPRHQTRFPADHAQPAILHFLGHHVELPPYQFAALAIRLKVAGVPAATQIARLATIHLFAAERAKELGRPAFRAVFGARRIRPSRTRFVVPATDKSLGPKSE